MTRRHLPVVAAIAAAAVLGVTSSARAADVDHKRLLDADKNPADWLTYHGTYKSWHYSGLDQINTKNIKNLKVAWSHVTPTSDARPAVVSAGGRRRAVLLRLAQPGCSRSTAPPAT